MQPSVKSHTFFVKMGRRTDDVGGPGGAAIKKIHSHLRLQSRWLVGKPVFATDVPAC